MYEHMHLQAPSDPEVDAFFSGGKWDLFFCNFNFGSKINTARDS